MIVSDTAETNIILKATQMIDQIAISFFTIEYLARLFLCPNKRKFFFDKMNLVDFFAIIPFYIALLLEGKLTNQKQSKTNDYWGLEDLEIIGKAGKIVRLVR